MMRSQLKPLEVAMPTDDDTPDEVHVTRAQGGDRLALGVLVRRHQRALFALCLRYVRDTDEAADLVAKVLRSRNGEALRSPGRRGISFLAPADWRSPRAQPPAR